jgi:hypothetical protein
MIYNMVKKLLIFILFFTVAGNAFAYDCDGALLYGTHEAIVGETKTYTLQIHNDSTEILNAVDVCRPDERWVFVDRPGVSWDIMNEGDIIWGDASINCLTFINGEIGGGIDWGGEFYLKAIRPAPDNEAKWSAIVWQDYPNYIGNTWGYCDMENTRMTIRGYELAPEIQSSMGDVLGSQVQVVQSIIPVAFVIVGGLVVTLFGLRLLINYVRNNFKKYDDWENGRGLD